MMQKYEQRTIPLPECESCSETGDCIDCDLQWQLTEYGELTLARKAAAAKNRTRTAASVYSSKSE